MARTAVAYSALTVNAKTADPAGTSVASANNATIAAAQPELTVLRVANASGSTATITIKAGALPLAAAGGQGDITGTVANSASAFFGPFESGRVLQSDGSMSVDTDQTVTITAFKVPRH